MKKALVSVLALLSMTAFAAAADMPVKSQPYVTAVSVPFNWQTWYLGASWGYGASTSGATAINPGSSTFAGPDLRMDGMLLGLQVGHDWLIAPRMLVGVVGDINWANVHGAAGFSSITATRDMTWLGNLDLRAGYLITPTLLWYAEGGMSVAGIKGRVSSLGNPNDIASESKTKFGWNVGTGFEGVLDQRNGVSVFVDARYISFKDSTVAFGEETTASAKNNYAVARVGLNWRPQQ